MQEKSLYQMLMNEHNRYVDEDKLLKYSTIINRLLIYIAITFVVGGIISSILANITHLFLYISFNEYTSLILGNLCFIYAFILLKNKIFFAAINNPVTIIGLLYPAFFNARILSILTANILNIPNAFYLLFIIVSVLIYYFGLNYYYKKVVKND